MVFEIQMGMIDRGASIQWCSQFPAEEEILFAPLTGLEVTGTPQVEGKTLVVELRLNTNLNDLTIEQIMAKMKKTHMDLIHTLKSDMNMLGFLPEQLGPLLEHEQKCKDLDGEHFSNADKYNYETAQALGAKLQSCSKAMIAAAGTAEASKEAAARILFKLGDSAALAVGVVTLLENESLLVEYTSELDEAADAAAKYNGLRLDLKGLKLTAALPDAVLRLLLSAEYFDLSENNFSNLQAETAQYDMIYICSKMQKWREVSALDLSNQKLAKKIVGLKMLLPLVDGLVELNLSGNDIDAEGAEAAAVGIKNCK
jgi:hypothetical protein